MRFVPILLAGSLALAAPRPVLTLSELSIDGCGQLSGVLEVRPRRRDRTVTVWVDDLATEVTVPGRAEQVPFTAPAGPHRHLHRVHASWRFVDTDPVNVDRPDWAVSVDARPPLDTAQGEVPPLSVDLLGCDGSGLSLRAEVDGGQVLYQGPADDAEVPLSHLREGSYPVTVRVLDEELEVAAHHVTVDVGPPCIDQDGDGHALCRRQDCDDTDASIHPGAEDIVGNGIDEDCDGANGQDRDRDGFEDAAVGGDDCDDHLALVNPGIRRFPDADGDGASPFDALDYDCDGTIDDRPGPFDCDDTDPAIPAPEAPVPNGIDDDCDGIVDEGTVAYDDDRDGLSEEQGDCNDADPTVHPGATETPDCRDEDCDGAIDEGLVRAQQDDRFEPNDEQHAKIPGATWTRGFLGGRYRPSSTRVRAVTRDRNDIERYVVYAHDGDFDTFHVTVKADRMGDGFAYEVSLTGGGTAVLDSASDRISVGGRAGTDDSGDYEIVVRPIAGELDWCPLELIVSTG